MRIGIVAPSGHKTGMGHLERQLAFARHATRAGHQVVLATNSEAGGRRAITAGIPAIVLPERGAADEAHRVWSSRPFDRTIVDLPDDALGPWTDFVDAHATVLALTPGIDVTPVGVPTIVRIGAELDVFDATNVVATQRGSTTVYAGRAYVLFRAEFEAPAPAYATRAEGTILVTHGGSDPWRLTERTLDILECTRGRYSVTVVVGSGFGPGREIDRRVAASRHDATLREDVPIAPLMRSAAFAIVNGGTTRFELCRTGTPFAAISATPQQLSTNEEFERIGGAVSIGLMHDVSDHDVADVIDRAMADRAGRARMHERMAALFDVRGAERLLRLTIDGRRPPSPRAGAPS